MRALSLFYRYIFSKYAFGQIVTKMKIVQKNEWNGRKYKTRPETLMNSTKINSTKQYISLMKIVKKDDRWKHIYLQNYT